MEMQSHAANPIDSAFFALSDPTRRAILARLARGDATVTELARPFTMSQPAISKHLKVLERAGLISRGREAQTRPCRLEGKRLKEATDWMERYRRFWEGAFDRMEELVMELQEKDEHDGRAKR
jgi:DNA-binding transcriptional ArsR family regulator